MLKFSTEVQTRGLFAVISHLGKVCMKLQAKSSETTLLLKHVITAYMTRLHGSQPLNAEDGNDWWGRRRSGCEAVALHPPLTLE